MTQSSQELSLHGSRCDSKIDALACVLPDADVQGEDRLAADWETYRIQSVEEEHFFGTVTHKNLQLVKLNGR